MGFSFLPLLVKSPEQDEMTSIILHCENSDIKPIEQIIPGVDISPLN